ncbi:MAG TPA: SDR family NAD(P)-dependent oxidoreductase, partial [Vicinamibacterales bacterium]|nr:SDR family NAD(P)-dependent oxidoreductase [Vicinamibacterales bacterium]
MAVSSESSLRGRVAVVTGGSRGIGRSIADALAAKGAAVGVMFREREAPAREFEAAVRNAGGQAWAGQCDLSDEASVGAFFDAAAAALGPVDILVNNAGITRDAHVLFHDRAKWETVLSVNLDAAYYCVRAVVRSMLLRRWGRIINVSSPSARLPLA